MSYTDRQLLSDIQRLMIEPTVDGGLTWTSTLWTGTEVLAYANQRQNRFLGETCLTGGWFEQATLAQEIQTLDEDVIYVKHAILENAAGVCHPLLPVSRFSADLALRGWPASTARPIGFMFEQTGTRTFSIVPPPTAVGLLHLFAVVVGALLDRSGITMDTPDEWIPTVRFGILEDMFAKQGEAYDEVRAGYCKERWQEGIDSAKAILEALL